MANFGTVHEGTDNILLAAYTGLELLLYTNAGNSLTRDSVYADLVEPDNAAEGYGAITLNGTWSATNSEISYLHPGNPTFTNNGGAGAWDEVTGAAICDGTYILHFLDFGTPITLLDTATLAIDISSITG